MRLLFIYEVTAVAMVFAAWFAEDRDARAAAVMVAVSRLIGDMAWIYLPLAPATWAHAAGLVDFTGVDTRALVDCVIATTVATLYLQKWWGLAVWAGMVSMLLAHVLRELAGLGYVGYAYAINGLFLAIVAVFFRLGGGGALRYVRDCVSRCTRSNRHFRNSVRATRHAKD